MTSRLDIVKNDSTKDNITIDYDMSKEEFIRALYYAEIAIFTKVHSSNNPKSIFVVAQPGAGKTALKSYVINKAHDAGGFNSYIEFNPDQIGTFHLNYADIMKCCPENSFPILQRFVKPALDNYLRKKALLLRTNIVQEGTFGATQGYIEALQFQLHGGEATIGDIIHVPEPNKKGEYDSIVRKIVTVNGGYDIEINAMAVSDLESLLSSYEREQFFIKNNLPPRAVSKVYHDDSYAKMLVTIEEVEKRGLFSAIKVFKRGYDESSPELVYVSGDNRYPSAKQAIISERKKNEIDILSNPAGYRARLDSLENEASIQTLKDKVKALRADFEARILEFEKNNNINYRSI